MDDNEPPPQNGCELAARIGAALDEGVVVALFPQVLEQVYEKELAVLDKKGNRMVAIVADCGPWGARVIDVHAPSGEDVKWWRCKEAAGIEGFDLIPTRWEGPIGEIPERYFREDAILGVRFWAHSPFFFPREKPTTKDKETSERKDSTTDEGGSGSTSAANADRDSDPAEGGPEGRGQSTDSLPAGGG